MALSIRLRVGTERCTLRNEVLSPTSFEIGDTTAFAEYTREGIVVQTKETVKMNFVRNRFLTINSFQIPLRESILDPSLTSTMLLFCSLTM